MDQSVPSRSTAQAWLVTPVPEDGGQASQEAALPSLQIPFSPGSTSSIPAGDGGRAVPAGLLAEGRGHSGAIPLKLKQTRALSYSHLC